MALDDIGALMFSHDIGLQNKTYFYREIGLCNLHGDSHALFSYNLPSPVHLTKTDIALMKQKSVNEHGMHYEISNDQLHQFEHLEADVTVWLQSVLTKDKPAVGVCDDGPLKSLLKSLDIPFVDISGFDPKKQCIGTTGVLPSGQGLPLCRYHYYGNDDIGFEDCARVRACQMSWWLRRQICYSPSLEQVNRQRVIWQTRCDRLMDMLLCEHCMNEKDKAYEEGEGLQWNPNCDGSCRRVAYILRDINHRLHAKPDYADEKVECLWMLKEDGKDI